MEAAPHFRRGLTARVANHRLERHQYVQPAREDQGRSLLPEADAFGAAGAATFAVG